MFGLCRSRKVFIVINGVDDDCDILQYSLVIWIEIWTKVRDHQTLSLYIVYTNLSRSLKTEPGAKRDQSLRIQSN